VDYLGKEAKMLIGGKSDGEFKKNARGEMGFEEYLKGGSFGLKEMFASRDEVDSYSYF